MDVVRVLELAVPRESSFSSAFLCDMPAAGGKVVDDHVVVGPGVMDIGVDDQPLVRAKAPATSAARTHRKLLVKWLCLGRTTTQYTVRQMHDKIPP